MFLYTIECLFICVCISLCVYNCVYKYICVCVILDSCVLHCVCCKMLQWLIFDSCAHLPCWVRMVSLSMFPGEWARVYVVISLSFVWLPVLCYVGIPSTTENTPHFHWNLSKVAQGGFEKVSKHVVSHLCISICLSFPCSPVMHSLYIGVNHIRI